MSGKILVLTYSDHKEHFTLLSVLKIFKVSLAFEVLLIYHLFTFKQLNISVKHHSTMISRLLNQSYTINNKFRGETETRLKNALEIETGPMSWQKSNTNAHKINLEDIGMCKVRFVMPAMYCGIINKVCLG